MPRLFLFLIGSKPPERNIEQHDVFFDIGESVKDVIPEVQAFWPGIKLHFDAWREVTCVDGHRVEVVSKADTTISTSKLFFLNLGGYKPGDFEEYHYKMLVAAPDKASAINKAKETAFFRHTGFKGATSHIDDKYGVDVDDIYEIVDILSEKTKEKYRILVVPDTERKEDELNIGYFKLGSFV